MLARGVCDARPALAAWPFDSASWRTAFEADAWRRYGDILTAHHRLGHSSTYLIRDLELLARREPVPARITFDRWSLTASELKTPAIDYPKVEADLGLPSPHRMPDGALCLYLPSASDHWTSDDGLAALIDLVRDHVELEGLWRADRRWRGPEEPHGLPRAS